MDCFTVKDGKWVLMVLDIVEVVQQTNKRQTWTLGLSWPWEPWRMTGTYTGWIRWLCHHSRFVPSSVPVVPTCFKGWVREQYSIANGQIPVSTCRFFPTCQVRVVRFYQSLSSSSSSSSSASSSASSPSSTSTSTVALPTLRQARPSSVCTAGPQPGTFPAQTWDLPSSVGTAGPQPGTCPAQCAPLDLNGQIECQKICQIERQIACQIECQEICQIKCQKICQIECQKICQKICQIECQIECQKICHIECQIECQKICQI